MALTEKTIIDLVEIINFKNIQVRQANIIEKDGVEVARTFHRYTLCINDNLDGQDEKIIGIAKIIWPEKFLTNTELSGTL